MSRGTTLVQPPVARTALKASNKAAAGNGAIRSLLRSDFGETARGPVIHSGAARRFAPSTGSLRGLSAVFIPFIAFAWKLF